MKSDLLPRSSGDFKLGADTFRKKLLYDGMGRHPARDSRFVVSHQSPHRADHLRPGRRHLRQGGLSHAIGLMETKRGTSDATYLYYTLGKLQIMKLREDLKDRQAPPSRSSNSTMTFCARAPRPSRSSARPCCTTTHRPPTEMPFEMVKCHS